MPATVHVNFRTVVHKSSGDISFAFPDVCKTPGPAIPIPYPNIAQSTDTANGSTTLTADGNPIMLKDSYYAMSTGDEAGTAGGNILTNRIKGKAYFILYSFDVKVEGRNVCRFLDPMTHNHSSPPPGTPPGPDIGGSVAVPTQVDIQPRTLVARVMKVELQSGIPMESRGLTSDVWDNAFPAGDLPPSGQPNWQRQGDDTPPPDDKRYPGVYTIEGGGSEKKLRVEIEITELENISGQGELFGEYLGYQIQANAPVPLQEGLSGWIDCEFETLPDHTRYEPGAGIQWFLRADGEDFAIGETKIEIFFIYATPVRPWNGKKLWYEALWYAFSMLNAGYLRAPADILTNVTRGLHGCGLRYDTESGRSLARWWPPNNGDYKLTKFMREALSSTSTARVNCYDMAATIMIFGGLMGVDNVKVIFLGYFPATHQQRVRDSVGLLDKPMFGFIKKTFLVGMRELCNDPFYESADAEAMDFLATVDAKYIDAALAAYQFGPIKSDDYDARTPFGNHAFTTRGRRAYDACSGPYVGSGSWRAYTDGSIDVKRSSDEWPGWSLQAMWATHRFYSVDSVS
jgi:hypothetical protein